MTTDRINAELDWINEAAERLARREGITLDEAIDQYLDALRRFSPSVYAALLRAARAA